MTERPSDFIRRRITDDIAAGRLTGRQVRTRFPPEPNGYLHIGHAKSIVLNFELADEFGGSCNLRFDDTNPSSAFPEFYQAIIDDIAWLGFQPAQIGYASDHFEQLYTWARELIRAGAAYVDDQDAATISEQRGGYGTPGRPSPFRDRTPDENLGLFARMRAGEFDDGSRVLRAKIDMAADNMVLRDPVLYRIRRARHPRTGTDWLLYPTYDWAHGQVDALEGITHSIATLEFADHRPLYDWLLAHLDLPAAPPTQIEFARLNLTHTVTSKRQLRQLIDSSAVDGWDDPRMPTLRGLRRRGYPPTAITAFLKHIGVAKTNSTVDIELLESFVRTELNRTAIRRLVVLDPLRVVVTNWPEGHVEWVDIANNPENLDDGTRQVPFTGELWIERDDFAVEPPPKFYRLSPGREVRLRNAFYITATDVVTDDDGAVVEVHCTYDPDSAGGSTPDRRRVRSTLHWVSAHHAVDTTVHIYDRLLSARPESDDDIASFAPATRQTLQAKAEPATGATPAGSVVQFERLGYFAADPELADTFHRTVGLRDEWARIQKRASSE
jgi:glutaminyl-tRNA synthetase